jgi:ribonuclease HII
VPRSLFHFERELFRAGTSLIAGVDEAGRGPLAGPVSAAAVILPADWYLGGLPKALKGLNDSKQLTPEKREQFFGVLTQLPGVRFGIAHVEVETIDHINILQATHRAMNQALAQLVPPPQHVLVDGLPVRSMVLAHTALVDGDCRSFSIAAASVLAKVTRDHLMMEYDRTYPAYGFKDHKGYSTPEHYAAIEALGPCPIHRRSFAPFRPVQTELFK